MTGLRVWASGVALLLMLTSGPAESADSVTKHVIVITMENMDSQDVYGNRKSAPYINKILMKNYARANNFEDPLSVETVSEPHYLWMEAGTNSFADHTFEKDDSVSPERSTNSTDHLVTQINTKGLTWMAYQEGMGPETGVCPIVSSGKYASRHNPFVFFQDVSGSPPDMNNPYCAAHHKPYTALAADLASGKLAEYVFITPDTCNDMHDKCGKQNELLTGDTWLSKQMPPLIKWANKNAAVIFLVWDEGNVTELLPFLAIGPGIKPNYQSDELYDHGSLVRTVEEIFGLPILPTVSENNSFSDLFKDGQYP